MAILNWPFSDLKTNKKLISMLKKPIWIEMSKGELVIKPDLLSIGFFSDDTTPGGAIFRGGDWIFNAGAGLFYTDLNSAPSVSSSRFGFRCRYVP